MLYFFLQLQHRYVNKNAPMQHHGVGTLAFAGAVQAFISGVQFVRIKSALLTEEIFSNSDFGVFIHNLSPKDALIRCEAALVVSFIFL